MTLRQLFTTFGVSILFFAGAWVTFDAVAPETILGSREAEASIGCGGCGSFDYGVFDFWFYNSFSEPLFNDNTTFFGGGGGGTFVPTPPPQPPAAPVCTLDLTKDEISWTSDHANIVSIVPLTDSPAVPGASGGSIPAGAGVFSGTFTALEVQNGNEIVAELQANGVPGASFDPNAPAFIDGFHADKLTADRLCSVLFPGTVNGTFGSRKYKSPENNTVLIWNGSSWTQRSAKGANSHIEGKDTFTCVTASTFGTHALSGSHTFVPPLGVGTHTYELTAEGPGGTAMCEASITVPPPPPPPPPGAPTCTLSLSPASVTSGESATLSWTTTAGASFSIDHGIGAVTPSVGGSVSTGALTTTTTFTGTVTNPSGDTATCTATVGVLPVEPPPPPPPPPTGPACTLSVTPASVASGESATLSWTSSNAASGSINNSAGNANPVSNGSVTVFPSSDTLYTGTFIGANNETVVCTASINVRTGGGGGGLDQPQVTLSSAPVGQVLGTSFVSLSQVPYTGFEAGAVLATLFWAAVAAWSVGVAYIILGKESMRLVADRLLLFAGVASATHPDEQALEDERYETAEEERAADEKGREGLGFTYSVQPSPEAEAAGRFNAVLPSAPESHMPKPETAPAPAVEAEEEQHNGIPALADVVESRAHAAGVLLSPEAVELAATLDADRATTLRLFGKLLNEAVRTIPREDGWILLSATRMRALAKEVAEDVSSVAEAGTGTATVVEKPAVAPVLNDSASDRLVAALLAEDRDEAFSLLSRLEHEDAPAHRLATKVATNLDALYRARKSGSVHSDMALSEKAEAVPDHTLHDLVEVFAHALDTAYASEYTGLKIALAQAFDIRATKAPHAG